MSPPILLYTDMSQTGWGIHLQDLTTTEKESRLHISIPAVKVVQLDLDVFKEKDLVLMSDTMVVGYLKKQGGGYLFDMSRLVQGLVGWLDFHRVSISAVYILGNGNI